MTPPISSTSGRPASLVSPATPSASAAGQVGSDAAARLFDEHAAGLLRYLGGRVGRSVAEDLVSETFLIIVEDLGRFDPLRGTPRSWLYAIATNLLRHHQRGQARGSVAEQRVARLQEAELDHADLVAGRVDAHRHAAHLAEAIDRLADDDRDILLLVAWAGLTPTEAAQAVGIPPGTARSRLHRVRRNLRRVAAELEPQYCSSEGPDDV